MWVSLLGKSHWDFTYFSSLPSTQKLTGGPNTCLAFLLTYKTMIWHFTFITCHMACLFPLKPLQAGTIYPYKIGAWCVCWLRGPEDIDLSGQGIPRGPHLMQSCSSRPSHFCWHQYPRAVVSITLDKVCMHLVWTVGCKLTANDCCCKITVQSPEQNMYVSQI